MKYEEIFRLKHLLEFFKIPFDFKENHFDGFHLMYPHKGDCVCSVVEFDGSYGAKQDLLEIQGLMTKREERETDGTKEHFSYDGRFHIYNLRKIFK